jgi:hypothetical protein
MNSRSNGLGISLFPKLRQSGKVMVRVIRLDASTSGNSEGGKLRRHNHASGLRLGQKRLVLRVTEKTQVLRSRSFERGKSFNADLWAAV